MRVVRSCSNDVCFPDAFVFSGTANDCVMQPDGLGAQFLSGNQSGVYSGSEQKWNGMRGRRSTTGGIGRCAPSKALATCGAL
jgi:hypothetical protein